MAEEFVFKITVKFNSPYTLSDIRGFLDGLMKTHSTYLTDQLSTDFENERISQKLSVVQLKSKKFLVYPKFGVRGDALKDRSILDGKYERILDTAKSELQDILSQKLRATDFEWHIHKPSGVVDE